jgi:predicted dehydrogenase
MNVLIVGLGSIARKHISALNSLQSDFNIYALRSKPNASIEEGVVNVYDLNCDVSFDFAIISNPTHLHYEYIEKLGKMKIPIFIEKPALHSLKNANNLIGIINNEQVDTYVACNLRFHPCIEFLKKEIESQNLKINEVNVYCGSYLPDWRPGKDYRKIYSANPLMGGGVHLDLFHELDYTTWLFGMPNMSNSTLRNVSSLKIDAIDYANYILQYDDFTANIVLNYYRRKAKRTIEVVHNNGVLIVDLINNRIIDDNDNIIYEVLKFEMKDTYSFQLRYFIDSITEKRKPMNSLKESIEILKIVLKDE